MESTLTAGSIDELLDAEYAQRFTDLTRLSRALGAGEASEDVAQETLVYARAHIGALREPGNLTAWLRRIAVRNVARERERRTGHRSPELTLRLPVDPTLGIDASDAIARLPPRERTTVILTYVMGYAQQEVADAMGIRRGTVAASLWKARRRLARQLADYDVRGSR